MGKSLDFVNYTSGKMLSGKSCQALKHGDLYMYWGDGKWKEIERHEKPAKEVFKLWKTSKYDQCVAWDNMDKATRKTKHRIVVECFDDVCDHYDNNKWSDPVEFIAEMVINKLPCHIMIKDVSRAKGVYEEIIGQIQEWAEDERLAEDI